MTTATTKVLNADQRRFLDAQTQRAREAAQRAAEDALRALAVAEPSRPGFLNGEQNKLRLALRDKARQLGDDNARAGAALTNLVHDVAYEQWHRLLFARFLEVNGLLRHPDYRDIPLSLEDCGDLAPDLGEPDAWAVAARFASEILPGVFRLTDPAVQVRFAAEHRAALERLLLDIPSDVFTTEDALGWVYQFWQTAEKKRVNDSGVKVGGADLSPVTQLFTENYMVRFLLENSLGAWWAARHPDSSLIASWEYLRRNEDGAPAAGSFSDWPERAADVTVIDPCCGSGHFLVAMFGMLWRMRAEEEGLTPTEAQDAVLRDNLHGLELDPRCTQIATFNVALEAWKQGGFRDLPAPHIACSGVPVRATRSDWEALAGDDDELRKVMVRLHALFRDADSLGSLIDPRPDTNGDGLFSRDLHIGVEWRHVRDVLRSALQAESIGDTVLGHAVDDVVGAASLLGREFTLIATNVPFLGKGKMSRTLLDSAPYSAAVGKEDLATVMLERCAALAGSAGAVAAVSPVYWQQIVSYKAFRSWILRTAPPRLVAQLGPGAFSEISGEVVQPSLTIFGASANPAPPVGFVEITGSSAADYQASLQSGLLSNSPSAELLHSPDARIAPLSASTAPLLATYAKAWQGVKTGDNAYFTASFWEVPEIAAPWLRMVSSSETTEYYSGRSSIVRDGREGCSVEWARIQGLEAWGGWGLAVSAVGRFRTTVYRGEVFDSSPTIIVPERPEFLKPIWEFCTSGELERAVRKIDSKTAVTTATIGKVPFDLDRWSAVADTTPALPDPHSNDPRQWLFDGDPVDSLYPLQVAVARTLGYHWPEQKPSELDELSDADGIAALLSLPGEPDLATRLRKLLHIAYGKAWSSSFERQLVTAAGGKNGKLDDWLRDSFFAQHVKVFDNRPFLWHIWDGRKDGFSAIVNYHRLDRRTLEKLTFTALGAWIDRQKHEARAERPGADARLAAAEELQRKLQLILGGEPPYDVYVRWKEMAGQPIGWEPDLDDGVRLNIRPFVTAGVLRSKVNVHWRKDRGTNPDGSERHNDLHPTLEERRAARREAGVTE